MKDTEGKNLQLQKKQKNKKKPSNPPSQTDGQKHLKKKKKGVRDCLSLEAFINLFLSKNRG